jgi:DNA primase
MGEQANFATLVELLRDGGADFESLIAEIAAETEAESEFDVVRQEMAGAVRQMKMRQVEDEMKQLSIAGLRDEIAQSRYRELMQRKEHLKRLTGADFG